MPSVVTILLKFLILGGVTLGEVCKCVSSAGDVTTAAPLRQSYVLTQIPDSVGPMLAVTGRMGLIQ